MRRINKVPFGFTLIELVLALAVFGVVIGLFGQSIFNASLYSARPAVLLQSNWIAEAYFDSVQHILTEKPATCFGKQLPVQAENSIPRLIQHCGLNETERLDVSAFFEEVSIDFLGYELSGSASLAANNNPALGFWVEAQVTVYHPVLDSVSFQRWIWVKV